MVSKIILTKEAFEYYILWLLVTVFLGMPQLWIDLLIQVTGKNITDGGEGSTFQNLLFVGSEVVISAAYGIWLTFFRKGVKPGLVIAHILFPLMLIIINCVVYFISFRNIGSDHAAALDNFLITVLVMSFFYASWSTLMVFAHEYQSQFVQTKR